MSQLSLLAATSNDLMILPDVIHIFSYNTAHVPGYDSNIYEKRLIGTCTTRLNIVSFPGYDRIWEVGLLPDARVNRHLLCSSVTLYVHFTT